MITPAEFIVSYLITLICFGGGYILGSTVGAIIEPKKVNTSNFDLGGEIEIKGQFTGITLALLSMPIVAATGVFLVGNRGNETASFFLT